MVPVETSRSAEQDKREYRNRYKACGYACENNDECEVTSNEAKGVSHEEAKKDLNGHNNDTTKMNRANQNISFIKNPLRTSSIAGVLQLPKH